MIIKNRLHWVIFSLVAGAATPAFADPIRVTDGHLTAASGGDFALSGERGLSLTGHVSVSTGIFGPYQQCNAVPECPEGTEVTLRSFWSGGDVSGTISFDGRTSPLNEFNGASVGLEFSGSFVAPPLAPTAVVTAPFQLIPVGSGSDLGSSFSIPGLGTHTLFGAGTATITLSGWAFSPSGDTSLNRWSVNSVRYDFSAAEPVPEPATMLLVGIGMAGVARRYAKVAPRDDVRARLSLLSCENSCRPDPPGAQHS